MEYSKPALSVPQQIELLVSRGLIVKNITFAEHTLSNISYYRLSSYLYPYRDKRSSFQDFLPGVQFEDITKIYSFDRKLRLLIFDAIERIEIAFRTRLSLILTFKLSTNWYAIKDNFYDDDKFNKSMKSFEKEFKLSKEVFIEHYKSKYSTLELPPSWIALEIFTFGQLSAHYSNLRDKKIKQLVADSFNLKAQILESWFHSLSYLRNLCAHHSRLWNRTLGISPLIPHTKNFKWLLNKNIHNNKLYYSLCIIKYLLNIIHPQNTFANKLSQLLSNYPMVDKNAIGFTPNWTSEPLWKMQSITS